MKRSALPKQLQLSKARLDELVDDALTDAYGESEQVTGFYTMLENDLHLPFETQILGVTATVESIDITEDDQLVAVCRRARRVNGFCSRNCRCYRHLPRGAEWIAAYRYWRTGVTR
jgi:hypothetical protein